MLKKHSVQSRVLKAEMLPTALARKMAKIKQNLYQVFKVKFLKKNNIYGTNTKVIEDKDESNKCVETLPMK